MDLYVRLDTISLLKESIAEHSDINHRIFFNPLSTIMKIKKKTNGA